MKRKLMSLLLCGAMVLNSGALAVTAQELPKQGGDEYGIMPVVEDFTAPELLSVSIDRTEVAQGEKITVTITATDDISGVSGASAYFYCKERNNSIAISGIGWAYGIPQYAQRQNCVLRQRSEARFR